MSKSTKYWPMTMGGLIEDALRLGRTPSEHFAKLEKKLGPVPQSPAEYTLAEGSDFRWIGPEIMNRNWIITPAWTQTSTGGTHSIEVWMADHERPTYANITPAEALQLAADLTAVATALIEGEN